LNDPNIDPNGFNEDIGTVSDSSWTYMRDLDDDDELERVRIFVNYTGSNLSDLNSTYDAVLFIFFWVLLFLFPKQVFYSHIYLYISVQIIFYIVY